jgi:hypothetical protein
VRGDARRIDPALPAGGLQDVVRLRAVERLVAALPGPEEVLVGQGHTTQRSNIVADGATGPFVQDHAPAPHRAFAHATAAFKQRTGDGDFVGDVALAGQHLANGPGQKLGDSVADTDSNDHHGPVAVALLRK